MTDRITTNAGDRLLDTREVMEMLHISSRTVDNYVAKGILPPPKRFSSCRGSKRFWKASAIISLIESMKTTSV